MTIGYVTLVVINGTIKIVANHWEKSVQLIWRKGTHRWNLDLPDVQMSIIGLQMIRLYNNSGPKNDHQQPPLLTWINLNPSMDE